MRYFALLGFKGFFKRFFLYLLNVINFEEFLIFINLYFTQKCALNIPV